jgi:hypothetical protein
MPSRNLVRGQLLPLLATVALLASGWSFAIVQSADKLTFTYRPDELKMGQSLGNDDCYVTLDNKTDLLSDRSSVRFGLRESINQRYYLLGWNVRVSVADGKPLLPLKTIFTPAYQESILEGRNISIRKQFFVPFENGYLRSAHFLFVATGGTGVGLVFYTHLVLPKNTNVRLAEYKGHKYLALRYSDGGESILWGSQSLKSFSVGASAAGDKDADVSAVFDWTLGPSDREYALSFAYSLVGGPQARQMLLNAIFDISSPESPSPGTHLFRVHKLLEDSVTAIDRYLKAARMLTPDPVVNRGYDWAKVNQLRVREQYKWGQGFSNNPPSDIVVGRDSYWYLSGSSFYSQPWSRKLLDLWFREGQELSGKFVEYMAASRHPIFEDDYGLNINDNTPLLMMAAYHYYSLTGDIAFLRDVYPQLLNAANYILSQRWVGEDNHYGLVWCTSKEKFVRGLCGWRNVIRNYNLSGAVTEVNTECYQALLRTSEIAQTMGDGPNAIRLRASAAGLRDAIQKYLRAKGPANQFYCLNIDPWGRRVEDMTSDLLFPVLEDVADRDLGRRILDELFSDHFWEGSSTGAGGIRTVSSAQPGYQPVSTPENYGLLGGVWPNVALWAGKAAGAEGLPDFTLRALRGTFLLSTRNDPIHYNVVPGEFSEYFNGNNLIQKGMPLSPFVPGIYIWTALEGLVGIFPHPTILWVAPAMPRGWDWMAVSNIPYRGSPLTILADGKNHTLYTTAPVQSTWRHEVVSESLQKKFIFVSDKPAFELVITKDSHLVVLAASAEATAAKVVDRETRRVIRSFSIPAGSLVEVGLHGTT